MQREIKPAPESGCLPTLIVATGIWVLIVVLIDHFAKTCATWF